MVAPDEPHSGSDYQVFRQAVPDSVTDERRYRAGFARSREELEAAQRLRFEVFNLELGEGLDESYRTGLDEDRFDPVCHHLVVVEKQTEQVIGTYRMQTDEMAERYGGFYSAGEFGLDGLPADVMQDTVEIGRACVAKEYRNRHVLFLLWKGLASYLTWNRKRYLFGCCSLTSQDPVEGKRVMEFLAREGHVHPTYRVTPQPGWECYGPDLELEPAAREQPVDIPKLFGLYLRYGAKVCSEPALDRHFKTIDYLVLFDLQDLDEHSRSIYFKK